MNDSLVLIITVDLLDKGWSAQVAEYHRSQCTSDIPHDAVIDWLTRNMPALEREVTRKALH